VGRAGDAVKVRGMFIVGKQAEQAIMASGSIVCYQLIVGRRQERDELTLRAELKNAAADAARLAEDLNRKFQDVCRVKIDKIEFVKTGTILEKERGIKDERKWE
jgi:phenylacetate-CoA ligase